MSHKSQLHEINNFICDGHPWSMNVHQICNIPDGLTMALRKDSFDSLMSFILLRIWYHIRIFSVHIVMTTLRGQWAMIINHTGSSTCSEIFSTWQGKSISYLSTANFSSVFHCIVWLQQSIEMSIACIVTNGLVT